MRQKGQGLKRPLGLMCSRACLLLWVRVTSEAQLQWQLVICLIMHDF